MGRVESRFPICQITERQQLDSRMSPGVVVKKGRGRPPKVVQDSAGEEMEEEEEEVTQVSNGKANGTSARSKKVLAEEEAAPVKKAKGRGRPPGKAKKAAAPTESEEDE